MNKRQEGSLYERKAAAYLEERGYRILERNYRCRIGEIDLIAEKDGYLVFIEVKYRKDHTMGSPLSAVTRRKQEKIRKTAAWYLMTRIGSDACRCRFDVVGITGEQVCVIENAFGV